MGGKELLHRDVVLPPHVPELPQNISARSWVLVDIDSGDVIAARDPHGRYQPASILKLLTCVTLLPLLPGNRKLVVSRRAAETEGSHAGLVAKGHYTVDQLFEGLLLVSGNDTAAALAEAAGGVKKTVALMNQKALALGAYDTYVQTPSGLDGWRQLTSAYDMALVLRAALAQPRFVRYDRVTTAVLPFQPVVGRVEMNNQNAFFLTAVTGALVAKSGYTDAARHTYVAAVKRDGRRFGVVLLSGERWPLDQWQQATQLVEWGAALPEGTPAIGHLDPAVTTPAKATQHRSSDASGGRAVAMSKNAGDWPGQSHNALVALAVAIFAAIAAFGWRVRRARSFSSRC
ncbi:MAG: penicillin-binding protein [Pseudonocardiales bacterium]